ncbi:MAG TPA: hypothetical protein VGZ00_10190 [Candidatus Baltobacteraceae bacterium]|jgi:hypothetical protein|nr:hypothetical protein [Candidatus Baltobacteraceae bacterium]
MPLSEKCNAIPDIRPAPFLLSFAPREYSTQRSVLKEGWILKSGEGTACGILSLLIKAGMVNYEMNQQRDNLAPEAKASWMSICQNAQLGKICDLFRTSEVRDSAFDGGRACLVSIATALRQLISARDISLTSQESLVLIEATNLFRGKFDDYLEEVDAITGRPQNRKHAHTIFREAIDAVWPVVEMGENRLWSGAIRRTPGWVKDLPEQKRPHM